MHQQQKSKAIAKPTCIKGEKSSTHEAAPQIVTLWTSVMTYAQWIFKSKISRFCGAVWNK